MQSVACRTCGNAVKVQKNSYEHTSVQWTETRSCVEFALLAGLDERALTRTCTEMRASIEEAVRDGAIDIGPGRIEAWSE